jgi:hypothetical protein
LVIDLAHVAEMPLVESRLPGTEHPVPLGGDGTPTITDFAPAELGCVLRISDGSAARLIGDALDLRHRLRSICTAALAGQVPAYQARHIASATRHLTVEQAGWVDAQLAPSLGAVSWGRLQTLLEAKIIQADPAGAEQQAAAAAAERFVRLGRTSEHGLKLIIARAAAGHAIWCKATIDGSPTSSPGKATPTRSRCAAPKPSASSPNPPKPSSCCANTKQTTGTDPQNHQLQPTNPLQMRMTKSTALTTLPRIRQSSTKPSSTTRTKLTRTKLTRSARTASIGRCNWRRV